MNKDRVYVVAMPDGKRRLVRATFAHIAERHAIGQLVHATVATKDDLIALLSAGVRVEDASDEPTPPPGGNGQDEHSPQMGLSV